MWLSARISRSTVTVNESMLEITERLLSDFPRVNSWQELLASTDDALLMLPREPLPPPYPSRDLASGELLKPLSLPTRPLNDLPQDCHYALMLHDALLIPPGRGQIQPPIPGQPWRRHTGTNLLLTRRHELIADSFAAGMSIPTNLEAISPMHWRYPSITAEPEHLETPCFYLEGIFGHYGHTIVEGLGRLWPLLTQGGPQSQDFLFVGFGHNECANPQKPLPDYLKMMLSILNIATESIKTLYRPAICSRLLIPERSAAYLGAYPSHATTDIWRRIGDRLNKLGSLNPTHKKLFLSRSRFKQDETARHLPQNQSYRLDNLFADLGYTVIHPQELPLAQQIALVRGAKFIAGCVGSQLHTLAFSTNTPASLLVIAPTFFADPVDRSIAMASEGAVDYYLVPCELAAGIARNKAPWKLTEEDFIKLPEIVRAWEVNQDPESINLKNPETNKSIKSEKMLLNKTKHSDEASVAPNKSMNQCASRINLLAKINEALSYLEIGVDQGSTFTKVSAKNKTAVDVKFRFNISNHFDCSERYFEIPSDQFFATIKDEERFDLIFIDGKHTFEQALRDLINSIFHSHKKTLWLLDDTVPCDPYSALRNPADAQRHRREAGVTINQNAWHGDVFKVVFAIHDLFPSLTYRTILSPGNPQTVLWRQARKDFQPVFSSIEEIGRLDYFDFKDHFNLLFPSEEDAVFQELRSTFREKEQRKATK